MALNDDNRRICVTTTNTTVLIAAKQPWHVNDLYRMRKTRTRMKAMMRIVPPSAKLT